MRKEIRYTLLPRQQEFLDSRAAYTAYIAGVGSGKTTAGSIFAAEKCIENPETVGFIGANSYKQLNQATLKIFCRTLEHFGLDCICNRRPKVKWRKPSRFKSHESIISVETGAQIIARSLENYDSLRGIEIGWAWLDETRDTRREAYDVIVGRLRDPHSARLEARITTTPNGMNWLYDIFGRARPNHNTIYARTYDNTFLSEHYIEGLETTYDTNLRAQELDGKFVNTARGQVYYNFSRDNVSGGIQWAKQHPLRLSMDFNVNPMCSLVMQKSSAELHVVDEIVLRSSSVEEMAEEFRRRYGAAQELVVYGDASGNSRNHVGSTTYSILDRIFSKRFARYGKKVPRRNPPLTDSINAVNQMFRNTEGRRRLFIHPRCGNLIRDLEQLSYKEGSGSIDESDPDRKHLSDCLRYCVYSEFRLDAPRRAQTLKLNL